VTEEIEKSPIPVRIIGWFGIGFALTYLLWGSVHIILSILDRTYTDMGQNIIFILIGIPILLAAIAYKNMQRWGWFALTGIFLFSIIWLIFKYTDIYGIILIAAMVIAFIGSLLPSVRKHYDISI